MSDLSHKFKEFKNIRTNAGSLDDYLVHTHTFTHIHTIRIIYRAGENSRYSVARTVTLVIY